MINVPEISRNVTTSNEDSGVGSGHNQSKNLTAQCLRVGTRMGQKTEPDTLSLKTTNFLVLILGRKVFSASTWDRVKRPHRVLGSCSGSICAAWPSTPAPQMHHEM